jgi:ABC-2 type transport system permease protein
VQTIVPLKLLTKTEQQNVMNDAILTARRAYLNPPLLLEEIGSEEIGSKELAASANPYTQSSPGIIIMFTFFSLISTASMLVIERTTGALARLMTTSLSRTEILLGHLLAMFTLVFMQQFLLVLFGQLVLNVNYFSQPLAVVLVIAFLSLWIASLGLLVGVFATTDDRAAVYTLIIMFIFTPLSGAWFPLEIAGKAFSIVGHLTPGAWAMDAYQNIVIRGLGLDSVVLACLVLLGYTLVTFLIAAWKFRRQSG